jgi:hypothetical protein
VSSTAFNILKKYSVRGKHFEICQFEKILLEGLVVSLPGPAMTGLTIT